MSSSEQAPEPTMDEILASIRKIISDDEPGASPQPETAAPEQAAPAHDGLASDLANALNDTHAGAARAAPETRPEAVDDILDLTQVVTEQPEPGAPQGDALQAALSSAGLPDTPPAVPAEQTPRDTHDPADQAGGGADIAAILAEAGVQDTAGVAPAESQPVPETSAYEQFSPAVPEADVPSASADDFAAFGQLHGDAAPSDASMPEGEAASAFGAEPFAPGEPSLDMGGDAAQAPHAGETAGEAADQPDISSASQPVIDAPTRQDTGFDTGNDGLTVEAPQAEDMAGSPETMHMPDLSAESASEPELPAAGIAAAGAAAFGEFADDAADGGDAVQLEEDAPAEAAVSAEGGVKTFEDSIKDMLRPMLREWLDDNMERIVQDTVKEEVASGGTRSDS